MKVSDRDNSDRIFLAVSLAAVIILVSLSIGALLIFSQRSMNSLFDRVEKQYRQDIINIVSVARNAVEPVLIKVRYGEIGREEAIRQIRALVRNMTYKDEYGNNYIFMSSYDGMMLVQPFEPDKESTDQWDPPGCRWSLYYPRVGQGGENVSERVFSCVTIITCPASMRCRRKLAYVVGLPELECYIGTGMYMQRAIQEQREILTNVKYASIWLLIAVLGPVSISIFVILKRNRLLLAEVRTRKKAEEDLKKGEEKYRSIFENSVEGIFQSSVDGPFAQCKSGPLSAQWAMSLPRR